MLHIFLWNLTVHTYFKNLLGFPYKVSDAFAGIVRSHPMCVPFSSLNLPALVLS